MQEASAVMIGVVRRRCFAARPSYETVKVEGDGRGAKAHAGTVMYQTGRGHLKWSQGIDLWTTSHRPKLRWPLLKLASSVHEVQLDGEDLVT